MKRIEPTLAAAIVCLGIGAGLLALMVVVNW